MEINEKQKVANYTISKNGKVEHEVKGLRFKDDSELMDWVLKSYKQCLSSSDHVDTSITRGGARYAGYYEVAQAIEKIPVGQLFTTRDVAKFIFDERDTKFSQTHANISADLSAFNKIKWYPDWLEVVGQRGRARLYKKRKDISAKQIEDDMRKAAKQAWNY